jgi:hypothetical protein
MRHLRKRQQAYFRNSTPSDDDLAFCSRLRSPQ